MMQVKKIGAATALFGLAVAAHVTAQQAPPPQGGLGGRAGGFVPGQQRPPGDAAQIERGKTLYGIQCRGCHGADLRGGDMGGPNLLRSQAALSDKEGDLIVPIIQGSRQSSGMPAIPMSPEDAKATAAYLRSVMETIGRQGMPPAIGMAATSILVGDAKAGQAFFDSKCASCHSRASDLQGIATRISDPKALQNTWIAGGGRGGRGGRSGSPPSGPSRRTVTVAVTLPSGQKVEGQLVRMDDFFVTLAQADGAIRTFRRDGDTPKVEVRDPMKPHRDLLAVYTDKDIHDVTAFLVTLK